ncbi:MAG TPA: CpsB/CapC family capsule biosynthesis tyrosine phosphatase [Chitinophagaceae bacterium]|nr:CpsB/CapC family capsule biosynthesis tyrosine phosphatase [Chitinophagaceae bacterium]
MFSFFKKKEILPANFSAIATDMHSHLLPNIDDGSPDVVTSIHLIKELTVLGYKKFITTPHVMQDLYKNTPATINAALNELKDALKYEDIQVDIQAAAEYLLDEGFDQLLEKGEPLLTLKDNLVLVEFSFVSLPINVQEKLFQMQMKGYRPVLAHPERYNYLANNKAFYDTLKNAGCLFQLNLLSLTGYYGKPTADLASYLLSKDYIDLVGTDLHHDRHLAGLQHYGPAYAAIQRLLDSGRLLNSQL